MLEWFTLIDDGSRSKAAILWFLRFSILFSILADPERLIPEGVDDECR
jgi:hypothetical protein